MKKVNIYTDGACSGNPGPGAYAAILKYRDIVKEISEGYSLTTNNRMELLAVIRGLEALRSACLVEIYTDSRLIVDAMTKGWIASWSKNNWKKKNKKTVLNLDLWKRLLDLANFHKLNFNWVKGHSGHKENERCDEIAKETIKAGNLAEDTYYASSLNK